MCAGRWLTGSAAGLVLLGAVAVAELREVEVGGELTIRGSYWSQEWFDFAPVPGIGNGPSLVRFGLPTISGRAIPDTVSGVIGLPFFPFSRGVVGTIKFDDRGNSVSTVEQRTRVNVGASFTNDVRAFFEVDSFEAWGDDFRSDYVTGFEFSANSSDDVEMFQAYIEMDNMFGEPWRARIGRQEIELGGGWLVADNSAGLAFQGLSFDGIKVDYRPEAQDGLKLQLFATKLADTSPIEEDGDVDFYGAYASYHIPSNDSLFLDIDGYWLFVRDARSREQNPLLFQGVSAITGAPLVHGLGTELLEDLFGYDDIGPTSLHTLGLRHTGVYSVGDSGELTWEAEVAYQFGEAGALAFGQIPSGNALGGAPFLGFRYVDSDADFDNLGLDVEVGYTFINVKFRPHLYAGYAYFEGNDESDITLWERINPFGERDVSTAFNRLFTEAEYSDFLDIEGGLSNVWVGTLGAWADFTDKIRVTGELVHFEVVDPFERPIYSNRWLVPVFGAGTISFLSPFTRESDDDLGWEGRLIMDYQYSDDLRFELGYSHFFTGDGIEDGNFIDFNGLQIAGGLDSDDADYVYFLTNLKF